MKKKLSLAHEVDIIVHLHAQSVKAGPTHSMGTAQACLDELVALGRRELAKL